MNGRAKGFTPARKRDQITRLIDQLIELRDQTNPDTEATNSGKDSAAFEALMVCGELTQAAAGWAIHHQIGLALQGLEFAARPPISLREHPDYLASVTAVDDHQHEHTGRSYLESAGADIDPRTARLLAIGLLRANPGAFPDFLTSMLTEGLVALEFGEVMPIFNKVTSNANLTLAAKRLQLWALGFIEYRHHRYGSTHAAARETVAKAFGLGTDAVEKWPSNLRKLLGHLAVARAQAGGRHRGLWAKKDPTAGTPEREFGETALVKAGQNYKSGLKNSVSPDN